MRYVLFLFSLLPMLAQDLVCSGSVRTRVESWDWFRGDANNGYTFPGSLIRFGIARSKAAYDW